MPFESPLIPCFRRWCKIERKEALCTIVTKAATPLTSEVDSSRSVAALGLLARLAR